MRPNEILIWIFTGVAALAIIGGAVFYVKRQQTMQEQQPTYVPPTPTEQVQPDVEIIRPAPEQEAQEQIQTPDAPPAPVPQQPSEDGKIMLDLSNVAGLIELDVPFMRIRDKMPLDHTCFSKNVSPAMDWSNAPSETASYAVFMERRDKGWEEGDEGFVNWILFNIPASSNGLGPSVPQISELPDGARHATADHSTVGYVGPCEPMGKYIYVLRVFALDTVLDVPANAAKYDLIRAMNGHIIDADEVEFIHYRRF